jgi:hypothetical protein
MEFSAGNKSNHLPHAMGNKQSRPSHTMGTKVSFSLPKRTVGSMDGGQHEVHKNDYSNSTFNEPLGLSKNQVLKKKKSKFEK